MKDRNQKEAHGSEQLLSDTQRLWHRRTGQPVSEAVASEALQNVVGFFEVLGSWETERTTDDIGIADDATLQTEREEPNDEHRVSLEDRVREVAAETQGSLDLER